MFRLGIDGPGDAKAEEGEFSDSSPYEGRDEVRGSGCVYSLNSKRGGGYCVVC